MNRKRIFVKICIGVALASSLAILFVWNAFFRSYYLDQRLAENVAVSTEWTDINTQGITEVRKDHQYVSLALEQPYFIDKQTGLIKTPKGEVAHPEVRILDDNGKEWPLVHHTDRYYGNLQYAEYGYPDGLQMGAKFVKVRIRSDIPITVRVVVWSGYNAADQP